MQSIYGEDIAHVGIRGTQADVIALVAHPVDCPAAVSMLHAPAELQGARLVPRSVTLQESRHPHCHANATRAGCITSEG